MRFLFQPPPSPLNVAVSFSLSLGCYDGDSCLLFVGDRVAREGEQCDGERPEDDDEEHAHTSFPTLRSFACVSVIRVTWSTSFNESNQTLTVIVGLRK